jgi:hypothetical protein
MIEWSKFGIVKVLDPEWDLALYWIRERRQEAGEQPSEECGSHSGLRLG